MFKVLCIVDKENTALDRLAKGVAQYHGNMDYTVLAVHPKRPDANQLRDFEVEARTADIIDWQYFRTAEMLNGAYPWLSGIKQVLTHNNPYSIIESDWNKYDAVVGNNQEIYKNLTLLTNAPTYYIPLTVDTDFWQFNPDYKPSNKVIMVANRIEGKKGILPVAQACAKANLRLILVGAVSDPNYMAQIMKTGVVSYYEQISDDQLRELYYVATVHVCNSQDNFESGTLPILEAMLCGVPVLTRNVGHVPDLYNGENLRILQYFPEDSEAIQGELEQLLFDKKALDELRDKAWQTAKTRSFERRAYMYQRLYREVLFPDQQSVSVIMPVNDNPNLARKSLEAIQQQTYKNIEVIIADDNAEEPNGQLAADFATYVNFPVRYMHTGKDNEYGLARARNEAVVEATGDILVFCDQRIVMNPDAIETFVSNLKKRHWLYGYKGARKEFVENFSCVYRRDLIYAGMFNERINRYGGMSQEIRERIREQGMKTEYVETAKAVAIGKSSNRNRKRADIIKMKNRLAKLYEL